MKILVQCYSSNVDAVTCEIALVDIPVDKLRRLRKVAEDAANSADEFYEMSVWNYSAQFMEGFLEFDLLPLTRYQREDFFRNEFIVVPDNYEFPAIDGVTPMHTEVNLMHVSPTDFHWSATVKYSDVTVETLTIPFKSIL